jgi:hypothetical protein
MFAGSAPEYQNSHNLNRLSRAGEAPDNGARKGLFR